MRAHVGAVASSVAVDEDASAAGSASIPAGRRGRLGGVRRRWTVLLVRFDPGCRRCGPGLLSVPPRFLPNDSDHEQREDKPRDSHRAPESNRCDWWLRGGLRGGLGHAAEILSNGMPMQSPAGKLHFRERRAACRARGVHAVLTLPSGGRVYTGCVHPSPAPARARVSRGFLNRWSHVRFVSGARELFGNWQRDTERPCQDVPRMTPSCVHECVQRAGSDRVLD